jgi:hypothetical protein
MRLERVGEELAQAVALVGLALGRRGHGLDGGVGQRAPLLAQLRAVGVHRDAALVLVLLLVEVHGDEHGAAVVDGVHDALVEHDALVLLARHQHLQLFLGQALAHLEGHVEGEVLLLDPVDHAAVVDSAVAGIQDDGRERPLRRGLRREQGFAGRRNGGQQGRREIAPHVPTSITSDPWNCQGREEGAPRPWPSRAGSAMLWA